LCFLAALAPIVQAILLRYMVTCVFFTFLHKKLTRRTAGIHWVHVAKRCRLRRRSQTLGSPSQNCCHQTQGWRRYQQLGRPRSAWVSGARDPAFTLDLTSASLTQFHRYMYFIAATLRSIAGCSRHTKWCGIKCKMRHSIRLINRRICIP
jgi:hypothetical protein